MDPLRDIEAYAAAIRGPPAIEIGAKTTKAGTIAADVSRYFRSGEFKALATATRTNRRLLLESFAHDHGEKRTARLEARHITAIVKAKATIHPGAARNLLIALRGFLAFASSLLGNARSVFGLGPRPTSPNSKTIGQSALKSG